MKTKTLVPKLGFCKINKPRLLSLLFFIVVIIHAKGQNCEALFYPINYSTPNNIYFIDSSTNATSWQWNFGDSAFSSEQYPSHQYNVSGKYYVCLTISDSSQSCTNTYCDSIFVGACMASFSFFSHANPKTVQFLMVSNGNPANVIWDFGDGTQSSETNPLHIYSQLGTYYVCLTSSDSIPICESNFCDSIFVGGTHPNIIVSICDGNWSDSFTWSNGNTPLQTDTVIIANNVILDMNVSVLPPGFLMINSTGELCGHYDLDAQFLTFGLMQVNNLTSEGNCANYEYVGTEGHYSGGGNSSWGMHGPVCIGCPSVCNPINPCLSTRDKIITVYPNPSNGQLNIINENRSKINSIEIFNNYGKRIYTISNITQLCEIDLSTYPKGIYFVKYNDEKEIHTEKILLQ
ncbi:MAG: PKD domain-containing protein [Bacteroidota bacterium]